MDDCMPQDEYFEWEDIILYRAPSEATTSEDANAGAIGKTQRHHHQTLEYHQSSTFTTRAFDDSDDFQYFQWADSDPTGREKSATTIQTSFTFRSFHASEEKDAPIDFPSHEGMKESPNPASPSPSPSSSHEGMKESPNPASPSPSPSSSHEGMKESPNPASPSPSPSSSHEGIDIGLGGLEIATPIIRDLPFPDPPLALAQARAQVDNQVNNQVDNTGVRPTLVRPTVTQTRDCSALCLGSASGLQPAANVNYLLHAWDEEDVSSSWRHVVRKRQTWADDAQHLSHSAWQRRNTVMRLENAAWRTWGKLRFGCGTTRPEAINWLKHCDDTCLYGPFSISSISKSRPCISRPSTPSLSSSSSSSLTSRAPLRTPKSKSDSCTTTTTTTKTPTPILKKHNIADILLRGSIPTFSLTSEPSPTTLQGRPLSDNSPLTYHQTSHQHIEFNPGPPTLSSCLLTQPQRKGRKTVKFLSEVRQYIIVNPIGDCKIHRTVQKTRSTTLDADAYSLQPEKNVEGLREGRYWSPESLWSYNQAGSQSQSQSQAGTKTGSGSGSEDPLKHAAWTWLGAVGNERDDAESDCFEASQPRPVHAQSHQDTALGTRYPSPCAPPPSYPHLRDLSPSSLDIGQRSLSCYYGTLLREARAAPDTTSGGGVEGPEDYLLSCTWGSDSGSPSPSLTSETSETDTEYQHEPSRRTSEESSHAELSFRVLASGGGNGDGKTGGGVSLEDGRGLGAGMGMGMGMRFGLGFETGIGVVGDERHRLYEQVMEEFNLEY